MRLKDHRDADAWQEFVAIYEPVIYRMGKQRNLQHADSAELVQRVMLAVAKAIDRFQPDRERARFRTWLFRITHNEFCKQLTQLRKQRASGDSAIHAMLDELVAEDSVDFSLEYRRSVFRWAAEQVRPKVQLSTWQAFWRTSVEQESVEEVAASLGMSVGAVYIARSRVMRKLCDKVKGLSQGDMPGGDGGQHP